MHVDAYRLQSAMELDDLDIDFAGSVVVVEWGAGLLDGVAESWLELDIVRPTGAGTGAAGVVHRTEGPDGSEAPSLDVDEPPHRLHPRRRSTLGRLAIRLRTLSGRSRLRVLLAIDTSAGTSVAVVDRDGGILSQVDVPTPCGMPR